MSPGGRTARLLVWAAGCLPLAHLVFDFATDGLGAEPVEAITHRTGDWALRMLILALAITPLRRVFGWNALAPHRRTFGLLAFGYAVLHFTTFLVFELDLRLDDLVGEVVERPYITVGFATLVLLSLLAATSTRASMRRLGRRWTKLHRLVYVAAAGAVVHYAWSVKADLRSPLIYGALVCVLLGLRRLPRRARPGQSGRNYATLPRSTGTGSDSEPEMRAATEGQ